MQLEYMSAQKLLILAMVVPMLALDMFFARWMISLLQGSATRMVVMRRVVIMRTFGSLGRRSRQQKEMYQKHASSLTPQQPQIKGTQLHGMLGGEEPHLLRSRRGQDGGYLAAVAAPDEVSDGPGQHQNITAVLGPVGQRQTNMLSWVMTLICWFVLLP